MWSKEDLDLAQEKERLGREFRFLKEEREILKGATCYPAGDYVVNCQKGSSSRFKSMKFRFVQEHKGHFPTNRLCYVVGVSARGLRAFRSRLAVLRQRSDKVALSHM